MIESGIPSIEAYSRILKSTMFKEMEDFSNAFLLKNAAVLENYAKRWSPDPLHQWSRQWEYPYVFSRISEHIQADARFKKNVETKILDAGSGATFFPYYIAAQVPGCEVFCTDRDASLTNVHARVCPTPDNHVRFKWGELNRLPFDDNTFDIVCCVSVLEHTNNYGDILNEFRRVLKEGGLLVITIDISLDGTADISPSGARILMDAVESRFCGKSAMDNAAQLAQASRPGILTTHYIRKMNKKLLPWRFPLLTALRSIARFRLPRALIPSLTVFCGAFVKCVAGPFGRQALVTVQTKPSLIRQRDI